LWTIAALKGVLVTKQKYAVIVDDNFYFMDGSERYKQGDYDTCVEAIRVCKTIVDNYLISAFEQGTTVIELLNSYKMFGEDPYIIGSSDCQYSSWEYAAERCEEIASK
jgi:hypothetical protein